MSVGSSRGTAWELLRVQVLERDGYTCQYNMAGCLIDKDLSVDHILAKKNEGEDIEQNLITACRPCNSKKGARMLTRAAWKNNRWFE